MSRKIIVRNTVVILICVGLFFLMRAYSVSYNKDIRSKKKLYAVDMYYGVENPMLVIDDLDYLADYLNFYGQKKRKKTSPAFMFPIISLPINAKVYEVEKLVNKDVTKVATYSINNGRLTFVWVYTDCLFDRPQ